MIRPPILPDVGVLVADPSEYSRRVIRECLRMAGIRRIHEIADGQTLPKMIRTMQPDIVILDLELPKLENQRLPLIQTERYVLPAIIAMTSRPTPALIECSRHVATGGVLVKPFSPGMLWLRLQSLTHILVSSGAHHGEMSEAQRRIDQILGTL